MVLGQQPDWTLNLQAGTLNLDSLLSHTSASDNNGVNQQGQSQARQLRPVIADNGIQQDYNSLRGFNARLSLTAEQLQWRGMHFTREKRYQQPARAADNSSDAGNLDGGRLSLPGSLDARGETPRASFEPQLDNVEIGSILKAFNYSINLTGKLSLTGEFSGGKIDADEFRRSWQGQAQIQMTDTRTEGLNFQQLVQQAVERSTNVQAQENYDNATRLDSVSTAFTLDNGQVTLKDMQGKSELMALTGQESLTC